MMRSLVPLAFLCVAACAEPETPLILTGERGACGSVVEGSSPGQVECPSECPIAVQAYRVVNSRSCERSSQKYVACIRAGGSGQPGAALLDTPDGPIFVDDPAFDCSGDDGCAGVSTFTADRWVGCDDADEGACACACTGSGDCPFDRFSEVLGSCGLATPCEPLNADTDPTEEQLQCYLDQLANGNAVRLELDVKSTNDVTGETRAVRRIMASSGRDAYVVDSAAYDAPSLHCQLQGPSFFFGCDPDEPMDVNFTNADGMIERGPCTDPRAWISNCEGAEPVCPG
ncbi:hypothetical protein [Paraliomyxa miuraensis]|uniref:hypothetical protein n=1 Tax=Paraliomyxa miuraensis TaxID=376150 RepID=UPI00224DFBEA|nr:hypothetical protein [Paraliomyxa miuraensis]MCX4246327.1 hypothetical protein [Paraliomyxa miuraensis]